MPSEVPLSSSIKRARRNHKAIYERWLAGETYQQLADSLELSKQRVHQIVATLKGRGDVGGRAVQTSYHARQWLLHMESRKSATGYEPNQDDLATAQRCKFLKKRHNALSSKNWAWEIKHSDLVFPTHCPILGLELDWFSESRKENSPSFDRVDPGKGYLKGNVVIMSWRANRIKNDGTASEHEAIGAWLRHATSIACQG